MTPISIYFWPVLSLMMRLIAYYHCCYLTHQIPISFHRDPYIFLLTSVICVVCHRHYYSPPLLLFEN